MRCSTGRPSGRTAGRRARSAAARWRQRDPAALLALVRTARRLRPHQTTVTLEGRSLDDPRAVVGGRPARAPSVKIYDGTWLRLVEVGAALAQRGYATAVDIVIDGGRPVLPLERGSLAAALRRPGVGRDLRAHRGRGRRAAAGAGAGLGLLRAAHDRRPGTPRARSRRSCPAPWRRCRRRSATTGSLPRRSPSSRRRQAERVGGQRRAAGRAPSRCAARSTRTSTTRRPSGRSATRRQVPRATARRTCGTPWARAERREVGAGGGAEDPLEVAGRSGSPGSRRVKMPPPSSLTTTRVRSGRGSCGADEQAVGVVEEGQVTQQGVGRGRCSASAIPTAVDTHPSIPARPAAGHHRGGAVGAGPTARSRSRTGLDEPTNRDARRAGGRSTVWATARPLGHGGPASATALASADAGLCQLLGPGAVATRSQGGSQDAQRVHGADDVGRVGPLGRGGHRLDAHARAAQQARPRAGPG